MTTDDAKLACYTELPDRYVPTTLSTTRDEIQGHIQKLNEELKTKRVGSPTRTDREIAKDRWVRLLKATKESQQ